MAVIVYFCSEMTILFGSTLQPGKTGGAYHHEHEDYVDRRDGQLAACTPYLRLDLAVREAGYTFAQIAERTGLSGDDVLAAVLVVPRLVGAG
jgi:hypothetical protein